MAGRTLALAGVLLAALVACQQLDAEIASSKPPALPMPDTSVQRPYLKTYNRLAYSDSHVGVGRRRCDRDGEPLTALAGIFLAINGVPIVDQWTENAEPRRLEDLERQSNTVSAYDMGSYRCVTFESLVEGVKIPPSGLLTAKVRTVDGDVMSGLWNATFNALDGPVVYNLTSRIGPVALSFSYGPQPDEEAEEFDVVDRLIRLYVYPPIENSNATYTGRGSPLLRAVEFMFPPQDAAVPSKVVVVSKTTNSFRLYFPKTFEGRPVDNYRFTFGLPGNPNLPDKVRIGIASEYELTGLTPGTPYFCLFDAISGNNTLERTFEVQTLASSSDVIPPFKGTGECAVYQEETGNVLVRMPIRRMVGAPDYQLMSVQIFDASTAELYVNATYTFPGDHNVACERCHVNGFLAKIKCVEGSHDDPQAPGLVFTDEVVVKRNFGASVTLPPIDEEYFLPKVVRTSANALVVRLPRKISKESRDLVRADVEISNLYTRELITTETVSHPGDTVVTVPDKGDWQVDLTVVDARGKTRKTSFQNYCPPKYSHAKGARTVGHPMLTVTPEGDILVNVGERLESNSRARVAEVVVLARDPFQSRAYPIASSSMMGFGNLVLRNVSRWETVAIQIDVTTEDRRGYDFFTLLRRSAGSQNAPTMGSRPSVTSLTRTGFMFRVPPSVRKHGMRVVASHLEVLETDTCEVLRKRELPGAGTFYVEELGAYPLTAAATLVYESSQPGEQGFPGANETLYFVPRLDGLPRFEYAGPIRVFVQRLTGPPRQRVIVRVPHRVTDVGDTARVEKVEVVITDGLIGPVILSDVISERGDYVIDSPSLNARAQIVARLAIHTDEGDVVERRVGSDELWREDPVGGYRVPEQVHTQGVPRVYPHPSGVVVHVPSTTARGAQVKEAQVTVFASAKGQEWTSSGEVVNTATVAGFSEGRVAVPSAMSVDVKVACMSFSGEELETTTFHVQSIGNVQAPMPAFGAPTLLPLDDQSIILRVPERALDLSEHKNKREVRYSIRNVDTGEYARLDQNATLGDNVVSAPTDFHSRFEFEVTVEEKVTGERTLTVLRVTHDDVVVSTHLPPLPSSGFPYALPFLRHVNKMCQILIRVPPLTADAGREILAVRTEVTDDATGRTLATPDLVVGEDNRVYIAESYCTRAARRSVTVRMVASDVTGAEHLLASEVLAPTGGLPPLPPTGHPRVLKTAKGRAFALVPQCLTVPCKPVKKAMLTVRLFHNQTEVGFMELQAGYTEIDHTMLELDSVYQFEFAVELEADDPRAPDPPPKTHTFSVEVKSLYELPNPPDSPESRAPESVKLMRRGHDLLVKVPARLPGGEHVSAAFLRISTAADHELVRELSLQGGTATTVVGLDPTAALEVEATLDTFQDWRTIEAQQEAEEEAKLVSFRQFYSPALAATLPEEAAVDPETTVPVVCRADGSGATVVVVVPRHTDDGDYVAAATIHVLSKTGASLKKLQATRGEHRTVPLGDLPGGGASQGVFIQTIAVITDPPAAAELESRKFVVEMLRLAALPVLRADAELPAVAQPQVFRNAQGALAVAVPRFITQNGDPVASASMTIRDLATGKVAKKGVLPVGVQTFDPHKIRVSTSDSYAFEFVVHLKGDADVQHDALSEEDKQVVHNIQKFVVHFSRLASLPLSDGEPVPAFGPPRLLRTSEDPGALVVQVPRRVRDGTFPAQVAMVSFVRHGTVHAETTVNVGESRLRLAELGVAPGGDDGSSGSGGGGDAPSYDVVIEVDTSDAVTPLPRQYVYTVPTTEGLAMLPQGMPEPIGPPVLFRTSDPSLVVLRVPERASFTSANVDSSRVKVLSTDGEEHGSFHGASGDIYISLRDLGLDKHSPLKFVVETQAITLARAAEDDPKALPVHGPSEFTTEPRPIALLLRFPEDQPVSQFGFPQVFTKLGNGSKVCDIYTCSLVARVSPHLFPPQSPVSNATLQIVNTIRNLVAFELPLVVGGDTELPLSSLTLGALDHFETRVSLIGNIGADKDIVSVTVAGGYARLPNEHGIIPAVCDTPRIARTIGDTRIALQVPATLHGDAGPAVESASATIFRMSAGAKEITSSSLVERTLTLQPGTTLLVDVVKDWGMSWFDSDRGLGVGVAFEVYVAGSESPQFFDFVTFRDTMRRDLPLVSDPARSEGDLKLQYAAHNSSLIVTCGGWRLLAPAPTTFALTNPDTGAFYKQQELTCPGTALVGLADVPSLPSGRTFNAELHVRSLAARPFLQTVAKDVRDKNPNITVVVPKFDGLPRVPQQAEQGGNEGDANAASVAEVGAPHLFQGESDTELWVQVPKRLTTASHPIKRAAITVRDADGNFVDKAELEPGMRMLSLQRALGSLSVDIALLYAADDGHHDAQAAATAAELQDGDNDDDNDDDAPTAGMPKDLAAKMRAQNFVVPTCGALLSSARAPAGAHRVLLLADSNDSDKVVVRVPRTSHEIFVNNASVTVRDVSGDEKKSLMLPPGDHSLSFGELGMDCDDPNARYVVSTHLVLDLPSPGERKRFTTPFSVAQLAPEPVSMELPLYGEPQLFNDHNVITARCPDRVSPMGHAVDRCELEVSQNGVVARSMVLRVGGATKLDLHGLPANVPYVFRSVVYERGSNAAPTSFQQTVTTPALLPPKDTSPHAPPLPTHGPPTLHVDAHASPAAPRVFVHVPQTVVQGGASVLNCRLVITDVESGQVAYDQTIPAGEKIVDYVSSGLKPPPHQYLFSMEVRLAEEGKPSVAADEDGVPLVRFTSTMAVRAQEPYVPEVGTPIILPVSTQDRVVEVKIPPQLQDGPFSDMRFCLWHSQDEPFHSAEPSTCWPVTAGEDKFVTFSSAGGSTGGGGGGACFDAPCYLAVRGVNNLGKFATLADATLSPPSNDVPDPVAPVVYSDSPTDLVVFNPYEGQSVRVEVIDLVTLEPVGTPIRHTRFSTPIDHDQWTARVLGTRAVRLWGMDEAIINGTGGVRIGNLQPVSDYEVRCHLVQEGGAASGGGGGGEDGEAAEDDDVETITRRVMTANFIAPVPTFAEPMPLGVVKTGGLIPHDVESISDANFAVVMLDEREISYATTFTTAKDTFGSGGRTLGSGGSEADYREEMAELAAEAAYAAASAGESAGGLECDHANITVRGGYSSIMLDFPRLFGGAPLCKLRVLLRQPGTSNIVFSAVESHPQTSNDDAVVEFEAGGLQNNRQYDLEVMYASCLQDATVCERTATGKVSTSGGLKEVDPLVEPAVLAKGSTMTCVRPMAPLPTNIDLLRIGYEDTYFRDPIILLEHRKDDQRRYNQSMGTDGVCAHNMRPGTRYRFVVMMREEVENRTTRLRQDNDKYVEQCVWLTTNKDLDASRKNAEPHWFYVDHSSVYIRLPEDERVVNYTIARVDYEADGVTMTGFPQLYHGLGYPNEYGPFYRVAALLQMTNYTFKVEAEYEGGGASRVWLFSVTTDSMFLHCTAGRPTDDMIPEFVPGPLATPYDAWVAGKTFLDLKFRESETVRTFGSRYSLTYDLDVANLEYDSLKEDELGFVPFIHYVKFNMPSPRAEGRIVRMRSGTPGYNYRVRIRVSNVWGETSAPGLRRVFTTASDVPEQCPELKVEDVGIRDMVVTWGPVGCPVSVVPPPVTTSYCNGNETIEYVLEISPGPTRDTDVYPSDFLVGGNSNNNNGNNNGNGGPTTLQGVTAPFVEVYRGDQLGAAVVDLVPSVNYTLRVRARNAQGYSAALVKKTRDNQPIRTLTTFPEQVTGLRNSTFLSEEVTIHWNKPRHNGVFIMFYNVFMRACPDPANCTGGWELACSRAVDTRCTVYNLTAGDHWEFRVSATNCKGSTDMFDDFYWVTMRNRLLIRTHPAAPSQPFELEAKSRTADSLELQFSAGDRDNGEPVQFYAVECDAGAYCLSSTIPAFPLEGVTYTLGKPDQERCAMVDGEQVCEKPCYRTWADQCAGGWRNGTYVLDGECAGNMTLSGQPVDVTPPGIPIAYRAAIYGEGSMAKFQQVIFCGTYPGAMPIIPEVQFDRFTPEQLKKRIGDPDVSAMADTFKIEDAKIAFLRSELKKRVCLSSGKTISTMVGDLRPANTYRCRAIAFNKEGYSMYSRSADPFAFNKGLQYGLFDYFRTADAAPEGVTGAEVHDPHFEWAPWNQHAVDNSAYFVGKLMTEADFPAVAEPEAQFSALGNPDRVRVRFDWDHPGGSQGENGQPVVRFVVSREQKARDRSSSGRRLKDEEKSPAVSAAGSPPAYMVLPVEDACTVTEDGRPHRCEFTDDMLFPDTEYEYTVNGMSAAGESPTETLAVKTTHGHPARPLCGEGEVYSRRFEVSCVTGDDWGSLVKEVTYQITSELGGDAIVAHPVPGCMNAAGGVDVDPSNPSCTHSMITNLETATTYTIVGWATNEVGDSQVSTKLEVTTLAGRPKPPGKPVNALRALKAPPTAEAGRELQTAVSPTSRRFAVQYTTPESRGADLTYCNVRVRGMWFGSEAFNNPVVRCEEGVEDVPEFHRDRFVDEDGNVLPEADDANRELLEAGCWVEERVYRSSVDFTFQQFKDLDGGLQDLALDRWGVFGDDRAVAKDSAVADEERLALLQSYGGMETSSASIDPLFSFNTTNQFAFGPSGGNKWIAQNALRHFTLPMVHNAEARPYDASGTPLGTRGRFDPNNPHLFASTTYQVAVSCANLCDHEQLMEEENMVRQENGEAPLDTSIGYRFCESEYSPPTLVVSKADPPEQPAVPVRVDATDVSIAVRYLMPKPMKDPILNWTLAIECVSGWCPELMCASIDATGTQYAGAMCSVASLQPGYCRGACVEPRAFRIPHCTSKKCATKDDSPEVFEELCDARQVQCSEGLDKIDMHMMQGQCAQDTQANRQMVKSLCCDWEYRLAHSFEECYDFGNSFVCTECEVGPPYGIKELVVDAGMVVSPDAAALESCAEDCDNHFRSGAGAGSCCRPEGTFRIMPGTTYRFLSMGTNVAGDSPWSEPLTVVTCAVSPVAPRNFRAQLDASTVRPGAAKAVRLDWDYPAFDGGARVHRYVLKYKAMDANPKWVEADTPLVCGGWESVDASCDPQEANARCDGETPSTATITGLLPGTMYKFMIKAVNAFGESEFTFIDAKRRGDLVASDEQLEAIQDTIFGNKFALDKDDAGGEPVGLITGGDLRDEDVPQPTVEACDWNSCRVKWSEPATVKSEAFLYAVEWRYYVSNGGACRDTSDPGADCLKADNSKSGFLGDEGSDLTWYAPGEDACVADRTQDGKPVTSCRSIVADKMSLSPTAWNDISEEATINDRHRVYQFRIHLVPTNTGSCRVMGESCETRQGKWSTVSQDTLNDNIFQGCKACNGYGSLTGDMKLYREPFENAADGAQVRPFCQCNCRDNRVGALCEVPIQRQECHCVGDPHCTTFRSAQARYFDFYCPGEHIFWAHAIHGVVECSDCAAKRHPREKIHNWMHPLNHVTASNKIALRWYDDQWRDHTVGLEIVGSSPAWRYSGPGPVQGSGGQVCGAGQCACVGSWDGKPGLPWSVKIQDDPPKYLKIVNQNMLLNELTKTDVQINQWGHYINVYVHADVPGSVEGLDQVNSDMANAPYTGMCGSEGAYVGTLRDQGRPDTRPSGCGAVYNSVNIPQFVTKDRADLSIYTYYGNTAKYCTERLRNGAAFENDLRLVSLGEDVGPRRNLSLAAGANGATTELGGNGIELVDAPKTYDVLKAERLMRVRNLRPILPRGTATVLGGDDGSAAGFGNGTALSDADLFAILNEDNKVKLGDALERTDEFIKLGKNDRHRRLERQQLETDLVQLDPASFDEVASFAPSSTGRYLCKTVTVEDPIEEFVLMLDQHQVDEKAEELNNTKPVDPAQMAADSVIQVDNSNLGARMDPEVRGTEACAPEVFEAAMAACAGLDRELQNCVEDICQTNDRQFAQVASDGESQRAALADKLATRNFQVGQDFNKNLAEQLASALEARGAECANVATGEELWNIAPFDREVVAWTYDRYVAAKKITLALAGQVALAEEGEENEGEDGQQPGGSSPPAQQLSARLSVFNMVSK